MAKSFVKITLAAKVRVLFGAAIVVIIGSALVVPWLYMEAMVDEKARRAGEEVTRLYLAEWQQHHPEWFKQEREGGQTNSQVAKWFTAGDSTELRTGPSFVRLREDQTLPEPSQRADRRALKTFQREPKEELVQVAETDDQGFQVYRTYRAVRVRTDQCLDCHGEAGQAAPPLRAGTLVGMVHADLPGESPDSSLFISRLVIVLAGVLAFVAATVLFYFITTRLFLSPIRKLKAVADKVAEGDLTVRSGIRTGDEFEQLGRSFDEMLGGITQTQEQLRAANRALDLKLNELAEANVALYEANRLKNEFLASVSHELRTPLNSIIGFAELLSENPDERIARYGANIATSARMLMRIINDLLDLARIEAGKARLSIARVSVSDICETLASLTGPFANKKDLKLTVELAPDLPVIQTDAGKVQQILYNLLSNAVKFTPAGGAVKLSARPGEDGSVAISVADTGPGISEAEQARIFEKFYQADQSVTREHGGTGLGLAIAKELTALLGGQLDLVSQIGQGATFTLTLPAVVPQEAAAVR